MRIDSYEEFAGCFDMKELYRFGLEHTIFAAPKAARAQAVERWKAWDNNKELSIRKSKRKFKDFYKTSMNKDVDVKDDNRHFRSILDKEMGFKGSVEIKNFQCSHVFGRVSNPILVCSVWNMAFSPNVVAAMTDDENMGTGKFAQDYHALVMGVAWKLYGDIIKDYKNRAAAVLQNVTPTAYKQAGIEESVVKEQWILPDEDDVFLKYEALCREMEIAPDFVCLPMEFDGAETNAIRIAFRSENKKEG